MFEAEQALFAYNPALALLLHVYHRRHRPPPTCRPSSIWEYMRARPPERS